MSLIFEALRRSESERTGHPLSESTATELLRAAEDDAIAKDREETIQASLVVPVQTDAKAVRQESDVHDIASFESVIPAPPKADQNSSGNADPDWVNRAGWAESKKESIASIAQGQAMRPSVSPDSRLICLTEEWSLAAEKFRLLGLRLRQWSQKHSLKNVLVTSTVAGEGKSFVCANLAITMSRKKGQRVLLIDGDLRRPVLTERFGLGQLFGLSECLKSGTSVSQCIYHLEELGLWFLPSGNQLDNALELMQSGHLPEMLAELGRSFDWIIIDSPPLIPLADTAFWSRLAHGILLVARQGKSERRALQRGMEILDRKSIVGVVLNASSSADQKSYYQRYGYGAPSIQNRAASGRESLI